MASATDGDADQPATAGGRFLKLASGYLAGRIVVQFFSLAAVPFYVRALGPARYSQVEVLTVAMLATQIAIWGIVSPAALRLGLERDRDGANRLWLAAASAALALQLVLAAIVLVAREDIAQWVRGPGAARAVVAAGLGLPLFIVQQVAFDVFASQRRSGAFAACAAAGGFISASGSVVFTVVLDGGAAGVLVSNAIGFAVSSVIAAALLGTSFFSRPRWADLAPLLRYGAPYLPGSIALWSLSFADRFILLAYRTATDVGRYAAAYRVGSVLLLLNTAIMSAWLPSLMAAEQAGKGEFAYRRGVVAITALFMHAAAGVAIFAAPILRIVVGPAFEAGAEVVPWIAAGVGLLGLVSVLQTGLLLEKRSGLIATAAIAAAAVNLATCYLLIPDHGPLGAGLATLAAYAVYATVTGVLSHRVWRTPFPFPGVAAAAAAPIAVLVWVGVADRSMASTLMQLGVIGASGAIAARLLVPDVLASLRDRH